MTKDELDSALSKVRTPAPLILVGPAHPIATYPGYNDPFPGWYRGARVMLVAGMGESASVVEQTSTAGSN